MPGTHHWNIFGAALYIQEIAMLLNLKGSEYSLPELVLKIALFSLPFSCLTHPHNAYHSLLQESCCHIKVPNGILFDMF